MSAAPQVWHYGLVARWWAEFNLDGPEIEYFRPFVEAGQPALDAGCGTGRLLIPYLRAGLDIDGCDVSADMLALCRERAEREGLRSPNLFAQPMDELDLPRRYRTIVVCGALGLGGSDLSAALRRFNDHLEPGGTLVADNEVPYAQPYLWRFFPKDDRRELPRPWREQGDRRPLPDGDELELRSRVVDVDPLAQTAAMEIRALLWRENEVVAEEQRALVTMLRSTREIVLELEAAGFADVEVRAGYEDRPLTADDDFAVFIARKPA
jgi:SAM-dependent methyltransferase